MAVAVAQTIFKVIELSNGRVGVEMTKPSGRRELVPDFENEAEANAWIIQTRRLIESAQPLSPGPKKRT